MITYGLGTITYRSKDEQNIPEIPIANINIPIGLSKEEYDELLNRTAKIGNVLAYSNLFSTIRWNFEDLVNTIRAYLRAFTKKDVKFLTARDMSLNVNKDLLNLLTSFRFYPDYMDNHLKEDFGKASELAVKFKDYCANEYDNSFSYRFIYHLRNYAQHKGFLVNSVNFGEVLGKENQFQINHYFKVSINRNDILKDKKFKKDLKPEIERLPEQIDIMEHVSKWMNSLARIHARITSEIVPTALDDAKVIQNCLEKLTHDPNDEMVILAIFATNHLDEDIKQIKSIDHIPLPVKDAKQIIEYAQKISDPKKV